MKLRPEEKVKLKAAHDADLKLYLEKIGLLEDLKNGKLRCSFCDCILTFDNVRGVSKINGKLKPFCQKKECCLEKLKKKFIHI